MTTVTKVTNNISGALQKKKKDKTIFDLIQDSKAQFAMALPKHMTGDKFTRVAITTIRNNPKLMNCNQMSLLGSLMTAAQLGLEPGVLGQCYLIPYGNECQFQISYKGMIELLRRSGQLKDIYAYTVHENDEFDMEYGLDRNLKHRPNRDNPGNATGYYAVAILKDDTKSFYYMTKKQIEEHKSKFSKASKSGPWVTDFDEMALKTVIKKMLKYLPVSTEFLENIQKDEKTIKVKEEININDENLIIDDIIDINEETGEIINNNNNDNNNNDDDNIKAEEIFKQK